MALKVYSCWKSTSAALWVGGLVAELSAGSPTTSSSSCSCRLGLPKSGRTLGVTRECAIGELRPLVGRRQGAVVVRASSGGSSGEDESKAVYDAFFLGKALAEAVNERVGSAIGEFLSYVGRRQAEQQKQIREFQDEVKERAAAAALKAAQKALTTQKAEEAKTPTAPPPPSPSPEQPPPSTSGLSNPDDTPKGVSIED